MMRFAAAARPAHMAVEAHAARDCRTMLEDARPYKLTISRSMSLRVLAILLAATSWKHHPQ